MTENNIFKHKFFRVAVVLVVIIFIVVRIYYYQQSNKLQQISQLIGQQETNDIVAKVSKLIVLPSDEVPTIATVSDPEALKDQPFFTNAMKGDKVLIYEKAKKAILYSVTFDKVIEVAPLNISAPIPNTKTAMPGVKPASNKK